VTVELVVPPGTRNAQLNVPVALAVSEPLVQLVLVIVTPSKLSELRAVDTENPVPDTVTVEPTGPWPGMTEMPGIVTVNVVVAVWPPTSFAVTVVPDVALGTKNVQLNAPVTPVIRDPLVQMEIATPSKTSPTVLDTEKLVPDTVTVAPTGPWIGFTVMPGVVTVNVVVAVWPPTSFAVTVVPDVALGTKNVQLNAPVAPVIRDPLVQMEIATPSKTSPTVLETENPVPDTATVEPTGP
jgi:hypothetical protein